MTFSDEKKNKHSWPKLVVRKRLNLKSYPKEFYADESIKDKLLTKPAYEKLARQKPYMSQHSNMQDLRVFVGTWNVGGEAPHSGLNLDEWVHPSLAPADIYVSGFQEIVPLNAANILGVADNGPAEKWVALIRQSTLNKNRIQRSRNEPTASEDQLYSFDSEFEDSRGYKNFPPFGSLSSEDERAFSPNSYTSSSDSSSSNSSEMNYILNSSGPNYCLAASK